MYQFKSPIFMNTKVKIIISNTMQKMVLFLLPELLN